MAAAAESAPETESSSVAASASPSAAVLAAAAVAAETVVCPCSTQKRRNNWKIYGRSSDFRTGERSALCGIDRDQVNGVVSYWCRSTWMRLLRLTVLSWQRCACAEKNVHSRV